MQGASTGVQSQTEQCVQMAVKVRFFASLAESLGRREAECPHAPGMTVATLWAGFSDGRPLPSGALCALNQDYCTPAQAVADGDEVAFFPPVTGG